MKYLYKFYWDCGRSGELEGLFVATEDEVKNAIGCRVYFGEVLGKHSEVYGNLEEGDIRKLDVSPEAVAEVAEILGIDWSGFNPLSYIETTCDECGQSDRVDYWNCEYREQFEMTLCEECLDKLKEDDE